MEQRLYRENQADASAIISYVGHGFRELLLRAQQAGTTLIHVQSGLPGRDKILNDERHRFRHLEPPWPTELIEEFLAKSREHLGRFDWIVAASAIVKRNLVDYTGVDANKIKIVPYGMPNIQTRFPTTPNRGSVLFVSRVDIGKGAQYFAEASRILRSRRRPYDFRVIGSMPKPFLEDPAFRGPSYLGNLPRSAVYEQMSKADVFVFPALADAFGLVQIEAMSCGVPIVATDMCGDVVRNGTDGFVVPARDAESLANNIERIVEDRDLRNRMSEQALQRAQYFSYESYFARLKDSLSEIFNTRL